jgi:DNA ligase-4
MTDELLMMMKNQSMVLQISKVLTLGHLCTSRYSTFVRIGSGLSFADYVWVRDKPWKVWNPKNPPEFLLTAKRTHEDKGDVYLEPEESVYQYGVREDDRSDRSLSSFILKVKAAEIVPSGWTYSPEVFLSS